MSRTSRRSFLYLCLSLVLLDSPALAFVLQGGQVSIAESLDRLEISDKKDEIPRPDTKEPWVEQVGLHPQVFYFHNFLSDAERAHMIRLAAPQMKRSEVSGDHGEGVIDDIRTSYGMFISRKADPIITGIERRIELFTHIPMVHQEDIQVLRYVKGEKYDAHYDSSYDKDDDGPHHRMATFYMYLSDVEEGGETAFPENSIWYNPAMGKTPAAMAASECARGHVHAKPKAGDAVLFYSFFQNGTMDPASMHTGCPVIKGIKWGAPVWIHIDQFEPGSFGSTPTPTELEEPGLCRDLHPSCKDWAEKGECEKNPGFMRGDGEQLGGCRLSCKVCSHCESWDIACINRNRKKEGYLHLDRAEFEKLGVDWWYENEPSPEL